MKRLTLLTLIVFSISIFTRADEGMWLLPLLKKLNIDKMHEMGLELSAEDIYSVNNSSLKDAVVIFGGGCTGEMISPEGLLLTNHHCGRGRIQSHSSVDHDYLKNGFWAMSREEELPNPGLTVTFLVRMEDVTEKILSGLTDEMNEDERTGKINETRFALEKEATEGTHYTASVRSFFGENQFYLLVFEVFKDVRLVGAPPQSIGNFGADTDNWMWPRHTGDFSMFRVYSGPDGKPADYSPDNIPYKPKHYLPINTKGLKEGDFTMVIGNPGGTQRYNTSFWLKEVLTVTHPNRVKIRGIKQDIMLGDMMKSDKIRIQYQSKFSGSSNYWKNSIGQMEALTKRNILEEKLKKEVAFNQWLKEDDTREKMYGEALPLIQKAIEGRKEYVHVTQYLRECLLSGSEIITFGLNLYRLQALLEKPDTNKDQIQEMIKEIKETAEGFYKDYNPPTDQKIVKAMLKLYREDVNPAYHPDFFQTIASKYKGDIDKYVDDMFKKSVLSDKDKFDVFISNPTKKTLDKDPAYRASASTMDKYSELNQQLQQFNTDLSKGRRLFIKGLLEMNKGKALYPDANFTMRLTYGKVGGYTARDAVEYDYYTTLAGVMEKEDPDNFEFIVADKLKTLYKNKDFAPYDEEGDMRLCFISDNDITGGNSGSPVLNGKGELIGIAFDGNWEAMSGDVVFETETQRCISTDIRYILFVIEKFAGAKHLVDEMTIIP